MGVQGPPTPSFSLPLKSLKESSPAQVFLVTYSSPVSWKPSSPRRSRVITPSWPPSLQRGLSYLPPPAPNPSFLRAAAVLGVWCGGRRGLRRFLGPNEPRPDFQARVFRAAPGACGSLRASAGSLARSRGHSRVLSRAVPGSARSCAVPVARSHARHGFHRPQSWERAPRSCAGALMLQTRVDRLLKRT